MSFLINPYAFAAPSAFLLDDYPGAAAAYSLRQLRAGVTNVVRVRRSSDNAELDFTAAQITDGTLIGWVGAGNNGFVRTWYDQSVNSINAVQGVNADQPAIVLAGTLVLTSGKPSIILNGTNQYMNLPQIDSPSNTSVFCLAKADSFASASINCRWLDIVTATSSLQLASDNKSQLMTMKNTAWQSGLNSTTYNEVRTTNRELLTALFLSASNALRRNGISQSETLSASVSSAGTIGKIGARADLIATTYFNGRFQEIVIYSSDQGANVPFIESNINGHYAIY